MNFLKEIYNISRNYKGSFTHTVSDLTDGENYYSDFDVKVNYEYAPASSSLHVHDDPTTREYHAPELVDVQAVLDDAVVLYNSETDKEIKTFPAGMDVSLLPGWGEDQNDELDKAIDSDIGHAGEDDTDGDDYRNDYDDSRY